MAPLGRLTSLIGLIMSGLHLGETLEEAFDSGTLVRKNGGIICMCTRRTSATSKAGAQDPRRLRLQPTQMRIDTISYTSQVHFRNYRFLE